MCSSFTDRFDDDEQSLKQLPEKITSVEQLFGTLHDDIELDEVRAERLSRDRTVFTNRGSHP